MPRRTILSLALLPWCGLCLGAEVADKGILTGDGVHMLPGGDFLMAATILQAWGIGAEEILTITKQDAARP